MKTVKPITFEGWSISLAQLLGSGPKFDVKCGSCRLWFRKRIQMVDNPAVECPHCRMVNVLPLVMEKG